MDFWRAFRLENACDAFTSKLISQVRAIPLERWSPAVYSDGVVSSSSAEATTDKGTTVKFDYVPSISPNGDSSVCLLIDGQRAAGFTYSDDCKWRHDPLYHLYCRVIRQITPEVKRLDRERERREKAEEATKQQQILDKL